VLMLKLLYSLDEDINMLLHSLNKRPYSMKQSNIDPNAVSRRRALSLFGAGILGASLPRLHALQPDDFLVKPIPSSGEQLPLIGLGSWITFNVGRDTGGLDQSARVMKAFFGAGGRMIDSSPMYGSSQATIGYGLEKNGIPEHLFAADKIWTAGAANGRQQLIETSQRWQIPQLSLLQVHNLRDWEAHLPILFEMKRKGQLGYVGVTTSHGRRHRDVERILASQPIDFVQVTYNGVDRAVERRLLPLALERGVAVIANRPYGGGRLIRHAKRNTLPAWVNEFDCNSWPEFLLKFVVSHPSVNCAIPATTNVDHVRENMQASTGVLPDARMRRRMADHLETL